MPNGQIDFLEVNNDIDQSNWGIVYIMYETNIHLNDFQTSVPDPENFRIQKESGFFMPILA